MKQLQCRSGTPAEQVQKDAMQLRNTETSFECVPIIFEPENVLQNTPSRLRDSMRVSQAFITSPCSQINESFVMQYFL